MVYVAIQKDYHAWYGTATPPGDFLPTGNVTTWRWHPTTMHGTVLVMTTTYEDTNTNTIYRIDGHATGPMSVLTGCTYVDVDDPDVEAFTVAERDTSTVMAKITTTTGESFHYGGLYRGLRRVVGVESGHMLDWEPIDMAKTDFRAEHNGTVYESLTWEFVNHTIDGPTSTYGRVLVVDGKITFVAPSESDSQEADVRDWAEVLVRRNG